MILIRGVETIDAARIVRFVLTLLLVIGAAREHTHRLERSAERQILAELGGKGQVRVQIVPWLDAVGVLLARAENITVYARGFDASHMPFFTETPVPNWRGTARQVHITMEDFRLRGLPIRRMEATIPRVALDSRAAAFALRIRLFGAGWGSSRVTLDEQCLTEFIARRVPEIRSVYVKVTSSHVTVTGELAAFLSSWQFEATGQLCVREGRQVVINAVQVRVEGQELPAVVVQKVMDALNPLLDIERDLKMGSAFVINRVEVGEGFVDLVGQATVPPRVEGGSYRNGK